MTLYKQLEHLSIELPEKTAIRYSGVDTSYLELLQEVQSCIGFLHHSCGLQSGDRVAFLSENTPAIFSLLFAASKMGLIVTPLNWRLSEEELAYAINDSQPSLLFHCGKYADKASAVATNTSIKHIVPWYDIKPDSSKTLPEFETTIDDDLLLIYTSGTTGRPKGAVLNQKAILASAAMSRDAFSMNLHDIILCVLPLFHVGGINIQALPGLLNGATLILHAAFDPAATAKAVSAHPITQLLVVPTILNALLEQKEWNISTVATLRCLGIGSMDVPIKQISHMQKLNIAVVQIYGATETGPVAIHQTIDDAMGTIGSIGKCGSLCKIRLIDSNNQDVESGETGEIIVKGANIFSRYWNDPEATSEACQDGWFKTGDVAKLDRNKQYWFTDRLKNVIISGGENIYAAEVERVLLSAPGVLEVAVIGIPDKTWGEAIVAAVTLEDQTSTNSESLQVHCKKALAKFKQPKHYYRVNSMPRTALGKIQSETLRGQILNHGVDELT